MNLYKKTVVIVTIFFAGVSGVFLLSGAGHPGLRLMVALIFFISCLNLSVYPREFGRWSKKVAQSAGGQLAVAAKPRDKKSGAEGRSGGPAKTKAKAAEGGPRRPEARPAKAARDPEPDLDDDDYDDQ